MKILLIFVICTLIVSAQVQELLEKSKQRNAQSLYLTKIRTVQNITLQNGQNQSNNDSFSDQPSFQAYSSSNSTTLITEPPQGQNTTTQNNSSYNQNVIRVLDLTKANFYKIEPKTQIQKYYNTTSGFYEVRLTYNTSSHSPDPFPEGTYFMINDTLIVIDLGYDPNSQDRELQAKYEKSYTQISKHTIDIPIVTSQLVRANTTSSEGYLKKINVNGTSELYEIKNEIEGHTKVTHTEGSIFRDPLTGSQDYFQTYNTVQTNGIHENEEGKQVLSGGSQSVTSNYEISVEHPDLISAERQYGGYTRDDNYKIKNYQEGYVTNHSSISTTNSYNNETINVSAFNDRFNFNEVQQDYLNQKSNNQDSYSKSQTEYQRETSLLDFTHTYINNQNYTSKLNETSGNTNIYISDDELEQFRYRNISQTQADKNDKLHLYNYTNSYQLENNTIYDRNDVNGYSRTKYNDTYTYEGQNNSNSSESTLYNTTKIGSYMKVPNRGVGRLFHLDE